MLARKRRAVVVAVVLALVTALVWVGFRLGRTPAPRAGESTRPPPSTHTTLEPPRPAAGQAGRARSQARTHHEQGASAYHARLFVEGDRVALVTPNGFTTFDAAGSAEEHALELGPGAIPHGDAILFWRSGSLRQVSLDGQQERQLAAVPRTPRYLLSSKGRLAWIHSGGGKKTSLQTISGGRVRVVHESPFDIAAAVLHATDVYWVTLHPDGAWSIGRVNLDAPHETSSETHRGRPPAMLAVGHDGLYFYDGPQRGVRRLTFDLTGETAVTSGVVCSPLAVSSQIVCAQVGGLFAISEPGAAPRFLATESSGPVTAVAATHDRAFWVTEKDDERLLVRSVELRAP